MTNDDKAHPNQREQARYDFASKAREVELDMFWKRSLFFWGFIGAAFVAFAAIRTSLRLSIVVSSFGLVCSVVWTLANRGSKFWYENWEQKVEESEMAVTGAWFGKSSPVKADIAWLQGRRHSVSKLAIALSDYVAALWCVLVISRVVLLVSPTGVSEAVRNGGAVAFSVASFIYALLLLRFTKPKPPRVGRSQ
jgi:hypothetical protein